jgi:hypothetical protein
MFDAMLVGPTSAAVTLNSLFASVGTAVLPSSPLVLDTRFTFSAALACAFQSAIGLGPVAPVRPVVLDPLIDRSAAIAALNQNAACRICPDPFALVKTQHAFAGIEPVLESHNSILSLARRYDRRLA